MFGVIVLILIVAGVACAIRHAWIRHREAREYGRHMHVRYDGHTPLYQRRTSSGADFGVMPEPDASRIWQHEDAVPSTLDLLYEQMASQEEGYRRRERERERERGY